MRKYGSLVVLLAIYALASSAPALLGASAEAIQTWGVAVTGVVIVWYTWETMRLRELAARQTELLLRPYVVFSAEGRQFALENVGNAVALNVRVDDVSIWEPANTIIRFHGRFAVLRPGEKRQVEATVLIDGQEKSDFLLAHLNPEYASQERPVTVRFANAEASEYAVTFSVGPGRLAAGGVLPSISGTS